MDHSNRPTTEEFFLFVYGTLMRGGPRASVLASQQFLAEATTASGYALYDLGPYPAMVRQDGASAVHGELLAVSTSLLDELDRVEGAPEMYRLEEIRLNEHAGPVFSYLYQPDTRGRRQIAGGQWDNRRAAPWHGGAL